MPKPVCVKCGLFFRPAYNGRVFEEGKPNGGEVQPVRYTAEDGTKWTSYKLWNGDEWKCLGCDARIIVGAGSAPMSEHYLPGYKELRDRYGGDAILFVHDC